jgi:hypothetical protein
MRERDYECPRDVPCFVEGDRRNVCDRLVVPIDGRYAASVNNRKGFARCEFVDAIMSIFNKDRGCDTLETPRFLKVGGGI